MKQQQQQVEQRQQTNQQAQQQPGFDILHPLMAGASGTAVRHGALQAGG